ALGLASNGGRRCVSSSSATTTTSLNVAASVCSSWRMPNRRSTPSPSSRRVAGAMNRATDNPTAARAASPFRRRIIGGGSEMHEPAQQRSAGVSGRRCHAEDSRGLAGGDAVESPRRELNTETEEIGATRLYREHDRIAWLVQALQPDRAGRHRAQNG